MLGFSQNSVNVVQSSPDSLLVIVFGGSVWRLQADMRLYTLECTLTKGIKIPFDPLFATELHKRDKGEFRKSGVVHRNRRLVWFCSFREWRKRSSCRKCC